ncbi:prepilin peptidase [Stappia sp. F7233]|uniref:Prepilin peptidase n=1 Tax=Stappia albiluteola TaxID=2758565 RepID=A0A839AB28_9HYPH|nr:prepilin peptidase [Stappia albiluteola]MBA5776234.1 prepilin peptidase [Stappia albiluteola]
MLSAVLVAIFPCLVIYAAVSDVLTMTIPNRISLALVAAFFGLAPVAGLSLAEFGYSLLAGLAVFCVLFACFAAGWMGGGDVKLATAISLWFGLSLPTLEFVQLVAIYGGLLTLAIILFRKYALIPVFAQKQEWLMRLHNPKSGVPYGVAIAAAAVQVFPKTIWFSALG